LRERGTILWTIGHSNRSIEQIVALLKEHKIEALVDVRSFPTSKIEHFKREEMERWLPEHGIEYVWFGKELGGYRRGGYEAHMKTELFREGIEKLLEFARQRPYALCVWRRIRNIATAVSSPPIWKERVWK